MSNLHGELTFPFERKVLNREIMSTEKESLDQQFDLAQKLLAFMEEQAAGYTTLTLPAHLQIEIEEQREKIAVLEARRNAAQSGNDADAPPNMLPRRESFFGRDEEIAKALAALDPQDRSWGLVIDGIGGIGKTALAVEVAYRCQEQSRFEGVLFATAKLTRLEPSGERTLPDNVPALDALLSELAHALGATGVAQSAGVEKRRGLLAYLRAYAGPARRVLVILDNLETLPPEEQVAAAEWMRNLPTHCKGIITSRRRAGDGAVWLRLERLAWDAARQLIAEEVRRSETLARVLAPAGAAHWQELYDATGGSPLALRWLLGLMGARALSIARAVALLRGAEADSPLHDFIYREARQEMGVDDWRLLSALALFAAPASFAALTAITGLTRLALESAVERLHAYALVDVLGPDGPYTLHPLTRALALAELKQQPDEGVDLRRAFGRYWVEYAEKYGGHSSNYPTHDRLEAEWRNLEAAATELYALTGLPGALTDDEAAKLLNDLVNALDNFMWFRGYWDENIRLSAWGYAAAASRQDWHNAGWRAHQAAWIHGIYARNEPDMANVWVTRCVEAWERGGSRREQAFGVRLRGLAAEQREDYAEAERFYQKALTVYRDLGAEVDQAVVLNDLGGVAQERQNYARAEDYYREALVIDEKRGHKEGQAIRLGNLGELALDRDRLAEARPLFERALALIREVKREDGIAETLWGLARVLEEEGRFAEALSLAEESLQIYQRLRHKDTEEARALVARLREQVGGG